MNLELTTVIIGIAANLLGLGAAAAAIAFRMGRFEGKVDEKMVSIDDTAKGVATELGRLNETNGGGFARCTQHTEKIMVLERSQVEHAIETERRQKEHAEEMTRRWDAIKERVGSKES